MHRDGLILASIALGHSLVHWYGSAFWIVLPLLSGDFGLNYSQTGLIVSVQTLVSATVNLPGGALVDMLGRRRVALAASLILPSLGYFLVGTAGSYGLVLLCIGLVGLGGSFWHPPAMATLSDRFPTRRGFALSMHELGANAGEFVGPLSVGLALMVLSWRNVLHLSVLPGVVMAAAVYLSLRQVEAQRGRGLDWRAYRTAALSLARNPVLLALAAISSFRSMAQNALLAFLPLYLARSLGLSMALVGMYVATLTFASLFAGPVMGTVSDRTGRRPVLVFGLLASGVLAALLAVVREGFPFQGTLLLLGLFLFSMRPVIMAYSLDVTPPSVGATTIGFMFSANMVLSSLSPLIAGYIADTYGLVDVFYLVGVLGLAAGVISFFLPAGRREPALTV